MDLNPFLPPLSAPPLLNAEQPHHLPFLPHPPANLDEEAQIISAPPPANLQEVHIAQLATASPPKHGPNHLNHPPYAEMIIAAIKSLNEKKGSSRKAIAKFIDSTYTNLPQSHSALLTHHLRRLKNHGIVLMIKHSYKLPKFSPPIHPTATTSESLLDKRGRGRPPKPKPITNSDGSLLQPKRGRGRPPKSISKPTVGGSRPRGRPRKVISGSDSGTAVVFVPRMVFFQPDQKRAVSSSTGRPVGRPRKTTVNSSFVDGGVVKPIGVSSGGRPVGRPRKDGSSASRVVKPMWVSTGRPVGRPRKDGSRVMKPKPKSVPTGRSVGRPPKVDGVRFSTRKQVGRPPKVDGVSVTTGRPVGRPPKEDRMRVSTGRPVGRPRKDDGIRISTGIPVGRPAKDDGTRVSTGRPVGRPPQKVGGGVKPMRVSTGRPVGRPRKVRIVEVMPEEMEVGMSGVNE